MNPVVSLQTTPVFPILATNSLRIATVSSVVVIAFTISTSFMITGGLKKRSPGNLSGRRVAAAISTIVRLDVFEQKIVGGGPALPSPADRVFFWSRCFAIAPTFTSPALWSERQGASRA